MSAKIYDLYRVGSDGKTLEGFKVSHNSVSDFDDAVMSTVGINNVARTTIAQDLLGKNTAADMRTLINAREDTALTSDDISNFAAAVSTLIDAALAKLAPVRNTADGFTTTNIVLNNGQIGIETDTNRIKIGDGTTAWNNLSYVTVEDTLTFTSN